MFLLALSSCSEDDDEESKLRHMYEEVLLLFDRGRSPRRREASERSLASFSAFVTKVLREPANELSLKEEVRECGLHGRLDARDAGLEELENEEVREGGLVGTSGGIRRGSRRGGIGESGVVNRD